MIKAYLTAIPSMYEGEDIEVRYSVYEEDQKLFSEMVLLDYRKPAVVGQFSLITLLKRLAEFKTQEVQILINDAGLEEFIRGVNKTRNSDMLKMARETRKHLDRYQYLVIKDVSKDPVKLAKWKEEVEF